MNFIFWQNSLSPHQSAFLRNLAERHNVYLLVDEETSLYRIKCGWSIPDFGKVKVSVNPSDTEINEKLNISDAIHIFQGCWAFKLPKKAFRLAIKKRLPFIGVYQEAYNPTGLKGKLRFFKYSLFRLLYGKRIKFILAPGYNGRDCLASVGFHESIIHVFGYFIEKQEFINRNTLHSTKQKLLFVGSISKRKNILSLVEVCKNLNIIDQLTIVGVGTLESKLRELIKNTNCNYLGKVSNNEVRQLIANSDVLIIPSFFDAYPLVVSESLMAGTPVIASDRCGSSILLQQNDHGRVFSIKNNDLEQVLLNFLKELPYSADKRKKVREWALRNISGEVAAKYFEEIIEYVMKERIERPVAPWLL
ncbi:MAG: glycosyltransferase [Prevotellaceae bacterium]|jgi:glycosyltransferase involved in cell wall biosynthesis|nr:glycosyltransferase [Prevotellaceae bacterium]